ncbi:MAG: urease accessory protein UreE [Burkholderiales bacterium]|nr:urease accessory protein UreE [Phycisphaerae bacterium]
MICERIIGRIAIDAEESESVEWVEIDWMQTVRRALRLRSTVGRAIDVLLPRGVNLHDGDVLAEMDGVRIAIRVRPCDLIVLRPLTIAHAAQMGIELGLVHCPVELAGTEIITLDDGPVRELAERLGVDFSRGRRAFHPLPGTVLAAITTRLQNQTRST